MSDRQDLVDDAAMGFSIVGTWETEEIGVAGLIEKIRHRVDGYAANLAYDVVSLIAAGSEMSGNGATNS